MTTTTEKPSSSFVVFRQHLKGFTVGALAACGAVTFTNPWETRLQLQGELQAHQASGSQRNPKQYPNAFSAMSRIFKTEGIAGIQKGLAPAYIYQILLNGTRLGLYDPLKLVIQSGVDRVASNITGDPNPTNPVAPAFRHGDFWCHVGCTRRLDRIAAVFDKNTHAILYKGQCTCCWTISIVWDHSVQLSSYDGCKQALLQSGWFDSSNGAEGGIGLHFVASLATSLLVCIAMNPFDVASTRMYNQHESADGKSGSLYKNGVDCLIKTVRSEGARALYKGFFANYLRVGPHTILTFVFLEQLRAAANRIELYFS
ncbi:hypothetical protein BASA83_011318 [Batrachochytrium salamandrivorans]|nr:hypothetical protein BASA83_011318 [Batrachochytrium salamandrivorans]